MRTTFLILMQVLLFSAVASAQTTKVVYTCPMHPEVQQAKPGNCPKCGMALEKKTIKVAAPKTPTKKTIKPPAAKTTSVKKPSTTTKTTASNDDVREMVKEMRGTVQELKTSVAELKAIVQEMKGIGEQTDTASKEEHHEQDMYM